MAGKSEGDPVRPANESVLTRCRITPVGKRRDGGTKYWCLEHRADATAKYGKRGKRCRYAHVPPVQETEVFKVILDEYAGGVGIWGAVPPIYDTTLLQVDRGIHVHARREVGGRKEVDRTYREVSIQRTASDQAVIIKDLDAIYFMVSSIFEFPMKLVRCTYCNFPHLDRDWFSVHPHKRHLCSGCGKTFRDDELGIGNPAVDISSQLGLQRPALKPSSEPLIIKQSDFPGGIRIWGSNPAIIWSGQESEESGIHVHAYKSEAQAFSKPDFDGTYSKVTVDGVTLDAKMVRVLMAQRALPHLTGRVVSIACSACRKDVYDQGEEAFTPTTIHVCTKCKGGLTPPGRLRKVIRNPLVGLLNKLSLTAVRPPQVHDLGLIPETL